MKTTMQLQRDVQAALQNVAHFNMGEIGVTAFKGRVILTGIQTQYSRIRLAEATAKLVRGVEEVVNHIYINLTTIDGIEKSDVEAELASSLEGGNKGIHVSIDVKEVTLSGTVNSQHQKDEAGRIAQKTPGIFNVVNNLEVS